MATILELHGIVVLTVMRVVRCPSCRWSARGEVRSILRLPTHCPRCNSQGLELPQAQL